MQNSKRVNILADILILPYTFRLHEIFCDGVHFLAVGRVLLMMAEQTSADTSAPGVPPSKRARMSESGK